MGLHNNQAKPKPGWMQDQGGSKRQSFESVNYGKKLVRIRE
jgi:hypothetical protein